MFTKTTVEGILSVFHKTIAKLEKHAEYHIDQANAHQQAANELLEKKAASVAEVDAATRALGKIKALVE